MRSIYDDDCYIPVENLLIFGAFRFSQSPVTACRLGYSFDELLETLTDLTTAIAVGKFKWGDFDSVDALDYQAKW
jgi:hypothetical protein